MILSLYLVCASVGPDCQQRHHVLRLTIHSCSWPSSLLPN